MAKSNWDRQLAATTAALKKQTAHRETLQKTQLQQERDCQQLVKTIHTLLTEKLETDIKPLLAAGQWCQVNLTRRKILKKISTLIETKGDGLKTGSAYFENINQSKQQFNDQIDELARQAFWQEKTVVQQMARLIQVATADTLLDWATLEEPIKNNIQEYIDEFVVDDQEEQRAWQAYTRLLETAKINCLQQWFTRHDVKLQLTNRRTKTIRLDQQQAAAILDEHQNTLVTARAGAGKTTTLVAKVVYLVKAKGVKPSAILMFCFNHDAAEEINDRLGRIIFDGQPLFTTQIRIASTFHSFAGRTFGQSNPYLKSNKDSFLRNRSDFITRLIRQREKIDPDFRQQVYDFFRKENLQVNKVHYESRDDYYRTLRDHLLQYTLSGNFVENREEKIIDDFFFEHGFTLDKKDVYNPKDQHYSYRCQEYRPSDFNKYAKKGVEFDSSTVVVPTFFITYFDVERQPRHLIWQHFPLTAAQMTPSELDEAQSRAYFFQHDWLDLEKVHEGGYPQHRILANTNYLQTDGQLADLSRPDVEQKIDELIRQHWPDFPDQRPAAELVNKVWEKTESRLTTMIGQFVGKLLKNPDEVERWRRKKDSWLAEGNDSPLANLTYFYNLAFTIYDDYLAGLRPDDLRPQYLIEAGYINQKLDDDLIIADGAANIENGQVDQLLADLDYLFIDEFQDFSPLFYKLVTAIKSRRPQIKTMTMGDNWQAINRFAGSDLKYFDSFAEYFPQDHAALNITSNHRSGQAIVKLGNQLMNLPPLIPGRPAVATSELKGSIEFPIDVNQDLYPHGGSRTTFDKWCAELKLDTNYCRESRLSRSYLLTINFYLEKYAQLGNVLILTRNNHTPFDDFKNSQKLEQIKKYYHQHYHREINFSTIHAAKGLESDTVIIVEADNDHLPFIHPDAIYDLIFYDSSQQWFETLLADERRLLYVALTRARNHVITLYNGVHLSSRWLNELKSLVSE